METIFFNTAVVIYALVWIVVITAIIVILFGRKWKIARYWLGKEDDK